MLQKKATILVPMIAITIVCSVAVFASMTAFFSRFVTNELAQFADVPPPAAQASLRSFSLSGFIVMTIILSIGTLAAFFTSKSIGTRLEADLDRALGDAETVRVKGFARYAVKNLENPENSENSAISDTPDISDIPDPEQKTAADQPHVRLPYARVLIVDDNVIIVDVVKGLMKPYGMNIDCVSDGYKAIDAIRDEKVIYDAVFMDHMMPGIDGVEATRVIREEIGTQYAKTVPIIALTANAIKGSRETYLSNGFQSYVSKPIDVKLLDAVIMRWVRNAEKESEQSILSSTEDMRTLIDRRSGVDRREAEKYVRLNVYDGIKRFGGDQAAYLQILQSFTENIGPLMDVVKDVTESNLQEYATTVHGIKASCRSICAYYAGDRAETLEKAARAGDYGYISEHNSALIEAVLVLLEDIDNLIMNHYKQNPKPKIKKPDAQVLSKLRAACENNDMDGADAAMAEIDGFEYEYGGSLVAWLRKNVSQMNFVQIVERLSGLPGQQKTCA